MPRPYHISRRAFRSPETEIASASASASGSGCRRGPRACACPTDVASARRTGHAHALTGLEPAGLDHSCARRLRGRFKAPRYGSSRHMSLAGREGVVIVHRHRYYAWLAFSFARGRFIAERHEERIGAGRDELRQQPRRRETTGHGYLSLTLLITNDRRRPAARRSCLARRCAHALLVCLRTTGCLFDV